MAMQRKLCPCGHAKSQHPEDKCDYAGYACFCKGYGLEHRCGGCGGTTHTADCPVVRALFGALVKDGTFKCIRHNQANCQECKERAS